MRRKEVVTVTETSHGQCQMYDNEGAVEFPYSEIPRVCVELETIYKLRLAAEPVSLGNTISGLGLDDEDDCA